MAESLFIQNTLKSARKPIHVPAFVQPSIANPYTQSPEYVWSSGQQHAFDHYTKAYQPPPRFGDDMLDEGRTQAGTQGPRRNITPADITNATANAENRSAFVSSNRSTGKERVSRAEESGASGATPVPPASDIGLSSTQGPPGETHARNNNSNGRHVDALDMIGGADVRPGSHNDSAYGSTALQNASGAGASGAAVQHLLQQINFLHCEVERLEKELSDTREEHASTMRKAFERSVHGSSSANTSLAAGPMASVYGPASAARRLQEHEEQRIVTEKKNLEERCRRLENQVAAVVAEKTAILSERHEISARLRKLESTSKQRQTALTESEAAFSEDKSALNAELAKMRRVMEGMNAEYATMQKQLTATTDELTALKLKAAGAKANLVSSHVQCDNKVETATVGISTEVPQTASAGCQVDTLRSALAAAGGMEEFNSLQQNLRARCAELDSARGDLHRLGEAHKETLDYFDMTKKRLAEETSRRRALEEDNEKLSLQVHAVQQQSSQLATHVREKDAMIADLQKQSHDAVSNALKLEKERSEWETELARNGKDMQNLISNQNFVHQQMNQMSKENEDLKLELQRMLQHEANQRLTVRAKDSELGEVLQAYQMAVREGENHVHQLQAMERELDNLRAALATKEERLVNAQEDIAQLHARDQQLSIDIQSYDYESAQLHHRLLKSEQTVAQLSAQLHDVQQHQNASGRVHQELERNVTELSKQLVIRDNEAMNLRMRCDSLEQECSALHTTRSAETSRLRELEDRSAKQAVRELLTRQAERTRDDQQLQTLTHELSQTREALRQKDRTIETTTADAEAERKRSSALLSELREQERTVSDQAKELTRLQHLLEEQAKALSSLP